MINTHTDLLKRVDESEYWLLVHITKRLGKNMFCWPSNETLMEDTGWSVDKLRDVKTKLIEKGLIDISVLPGKSNRYFVKTDLIGVFVDASKLSSDPLGKTIGVGKNQQAPPRKNQHTTPSEKPTTKYYTSEVLSMEDINRSLPTIVIEELPPKYIQNLNLYFTERIEQSYEVFRMQNKGDYESMCSEFMKKKNGDRFKEVGHVWSSFKRYLRENKSEAINQPTKLKAKWS